MQDEATDFPAQSAPLVPTSGSKYAILAELGRGGMATAFLAAVSGPGGFNKLVVVKRLRSSLAAEPEFLKMFLEEARLSARIEHPNVVHTTEVGFDGKHHYIAMEYLDGQAFENIFRRLLKQLKSEVTDPAAQRDLAGEAAFPLKLHLHVISQALLGLDCAHELKDFDGTPLNVVHRDVSPHNIVVTYDGHVKLLDFGIAKAADSSGDTRTGVMKGKCAYMPAEQFGGRQIDRRADVFAVGVILWQALAGQRLWRGMSDAEIFQKVAGGDIQHPKAVNPSVPDELDAICMKALGHKPDDRFATAAEFQQALEDYIASHKELRTNSRELGKFVGELFADDRTKMKAVIEAQLGKSSVNNGPVSSQVSSNVSLPVIGATQSSYSGVNTQTFGVEAAPAKSNNLKLFAGIALGAAAIAVIGSVALRKPGPGSTSTTTQTTTAPPPTLASAPVDVPVAVAVPTSEVHVHGTPDTARFTFDGASLDGNPATTTFRSDGVSHLVEATAPGFAKKNVFVTLDKPDVSVEVTLEKVPEALPNRTLGTGGGKGVQRPPPVASPPSSAATPPVTPPTTTTTTTTSPPPASSDKPRGITLDKNDPWAKGSH